MKLYLTFLCTILVLIAAALPQRLNAQDLPSVQLEMREYDGIIVPSGIVISAINMQEISTETCPVGYKVKFVSTNDLYMNETNVIPQYTELYGYIEKINEPIVGTNASMKVKITKIILPDKYEMPVRAYLYTSNDNLIGGELTAPAEYIKMPHYQSKFQGISWNHRAATLQVRPGGKRSMGAHTKIPSGEQVLIILTSPLEITHIVSD